jgi:hypothetical protein
LVLSNCGSIDVFKNFSSKSCLRGCLRYRRGLSSWFGLEKSEDDSGES